MLGWTLWDIYKMAAATELEGVAACYVVTGAPLPVWLKAGNCAPLFSTGVWQTISLLQTYKQDWRDLLNGGPARPSSLVAAIETTLIADVPIVASKVEWRLRAIRVAAATEDRINFHEGWPVEPAGARSIFISALSEEEKLGEMAATGDLEAEGYLRTTAR